MPKRTAAPDLAETNPALPTPRWVSIEVPIRGEGGLPDLGADPRTTTRVARRATKWVARLRPRSEAWWVAQAAAAAVAVACGVGVEVGAAAVGRVTVTGRTARQ